MKVLVTGATGFIGSNLVRSLLKRNVEVRALVRRESGLNNINGLDVELFYGDVRDRSSLKKACEGCEVLYHTAALYSFWAPDSRAFYEVNVQGTRNTLEEARAAGISKIVYTSTVATIRCPEDPNHPSDENDYPTPQDFHNDYKRSKFLAEQVVLAFANEGLPVVIVNPSAPIGSYDVKPTPTGKIVLDFLKGQVPAYINTGLNIIDVEDVAEGHILAAEKGKVGERYILGNENIPLREIFERIAQCAGKSAPRYRIPYGVALAAAYGSELVSGLLKKSPRIHLSTVRMAKRYMYFNPAKAVRELGLPQSPVEGAIAKAIRWFRASGYLE